VEDFFRRQTVFGFDTETNVVDGPFAWHQRRLRAIQIGDRNEQYVIDLLGLARSTAELIDAQSNYGRNDRLHTFGPLREVLRPALESKSWLKVGANLQFDYETPKWCLGLRPWNFYDVQIAEKLLYAGKVGFFESGFWGLADLVARYLKLYISKEEQTSFDFSTPLTEKQVNYAALDTRLPLAIKNIQRPLLEQAVLLRVAQIEFDAIPAFGDMHLNGIKLDRTEWMKLVESNKEKKTELVSKLDEHFVPIMGRKEQPPAQEELDRLENIWKNTKDKEVRAIARQQFMKERKKVTVFNREGDKYEGSAAINYGAPAQLRDALLTLPQFTHKNLPDSNDQTLKKLAFDPIVALIREYRKIDKLLDTYGVSWADENINPFTGRVHSSIHQMGAETGRTSSSRPNIQNLPRDKRYRHCFVAEKGWKILTLDYNGCELRILAEYSQDHTWINAFLNDWDVHSVCAEILLGDKWKAQAEEGCAYYTKHQKCSCKGHKKFRDWIKAINFGIAYGMTARRLALELGISEEEASNLLRLYFKAFPVLVAYLEKSGSHAKQRQEARTLSMRRRLFPKPTWEQAARICQKKLGRTPNQNEISKQYAGIYASIEREGKNTPIQGSNADIAKLAMGCGFDENGKPFMWHILEPEYNGKQVSFVHDENVGEVPVEPTEDIMPGYVGDGQFTEDNAQAAFDAIGDCMTRAGAELVKSIPMTYEGTIDTKWTK
jgi:DNA polymerase-1